jgi:hypothetical protein
MILYQANINDPADEDVIECDGLCGRTVAWGDSGLWHAPKIEGKHYCPECRKEEGI